MGLLRPEAAYETREHVPGPSVVEPAFEARESRTSCEGGEHGEQLDILESVCASSAVVCEQMNPDFQLHRLGWQAFQDLAEVVLRDALGQHMMVFSPAHDAGKDGAFCGPAQPTPRAVLGGVVGQVVVQVKHFGNPDTKLTRSRLTKEVQKVANLVAEGQCDSYIIITNGSLTGRSHIAIDNAFKAVGVKTCLILGGEWMGQTIRDSPRLRSLVPRVYGLGDLTQILDERMYSQAQALLESLGPDLATFVPTHSYRRAVEALDAHGFVLLIGEAGAGKSVTAATLAVAAADLGLPAVRVDDPNDIRHWNPRDKQLLWVDDAFGATKYLPNLGEIWNRKLPYINAARRRGSRVVLTSRDYIWNAARRDLKMASFPFLIEQQIAIEVADLTARERERILNAHLRLGRQPRPFRKSVKQHLRRVCREVAFLPEAARRLADPLFTSSIDPEKYLDVSTFLSTPEAYLAEMLQQLDAQNEAAIALLFTHGFALPSPWVPDADDEFLLSHIGSDAAGVRRALAALEGSMIRLDRASSEYRFRHPSIADGYARYLSMDPEKLQIWVAGAPLERILAEARIDLPAAAGDAIVVPRALWPHVVSRLEGATPTQFHDVAGFLARNCSSEFARGFLETHERFRRFLTHPSMFIGPWSMEPILLMLLHDRDALPEVARGELSEHLEEIAVLGPDIGWLANRYIQQLLSEEDRVRIRATVRKGLLSNDGEEILSGWDTSNYPGPDWGTPEVYVEPLVDAVTAYRDEFSEDPLVLSALDGVERHVGYLVDRLYEEYEELGLTDIEKLIPVRPNAPDAPLEVDSARDPFDDLDI